MQNNVLSTELVMLTVRDVARALKLSTRQVFKLAKAGTIPAPVRIGRAVRWRASDVQAFIARGGAAAPAVKP